MHQAEIVMALRMLVVARVIVANKIALPYPVVLVLR